MTNNSEQVTPDNQQQPNPTEANANQNSQPQPQETEVVDIDAKDLADAKAAAEAEKAAGTGEGNDPASGGASQQPNQAQASDQGQQPNGQAPTGETPMIPKPRFDEVNARATKAEQEAAYWKGVADARGQGTQNQGGTQQTQQQQAQPTAEQQLAAIHSKQDELAQKFDNGEITYSDLLKSQRALSAQEQAIHETQLLSKVQPAQGNQQQAQNDHLYLDTLTAQLETEHPWVQIFDKVGTDVDWKYLKDRAVENCTAKGVDVSNGDIGRYNLRKEVAEIADSLGPGMIAERAKAKGIAIPGQQQQVTQNQGGNQQPLSPEARARANKLDLAENMPPNVQRMSGATGDGTPTDARIEQMSDDEIGALPDSTRRKLLGIM